MPYRGVTRCLIVLYDITSSPRPEHLSDEQWELILKMCAFEPSLRPEITVVVEKLKQFAESELNDNLGHTSECFSFNASISSDRSTGFRSVSNLSASADESHGVQLSSAAASSQSSGRTFSSSTCSISTLTGEDFLPQVLDLHDYLDLLAALVDVQCDAIDKICNEAKTLQLKDPQAFITERYNDHMNQLRPEWMARNHVTQDTLTTCMLIYEDRVELQSTRLSLQQKLRHRAAKAVENFNGLVDPAIAF